jgi:hypothetical protein
MHYLSFIKKKNIYIYNIYILLNDFMITLSCIYSIKWACVHACKIADVSGPIRRKVLVGEFMFHPTPHDTASFSVFSVYLYIGNNMLIIQIQ